MYSTMQQVVQKHHQAFSIHSDDRSSNTIPHEEQRDIAATELSQAVRIISSQSLSAIRNSATNRGRHRGIITVSKRRCILGDTTNTLQRNTNRDNA